jgi:dTDP-4-amino-4,6-dideoxygalactose transaminase
MNVPLQDLRRDQAPLSEDLQAAVREVFESAEFVLGRFVERFEHDVAEYVGVKHAIGVASGSDALLLAIKALGIGRGDEVITTPSSFVATASSIVHAGATPVFADVLPDTLNIDPAAVSAAIGERTAAILPVHLYGQMADMDEIRALAARHGLEVIEDAAQAIGASQVKGAGTGPGKSSPGVWHAGAAGDAGCFSFYPTKNLGGWGDGGLVTTNDTRTADGLRCLRDCGQLPTDRDLNAPTLLGHNSRLDAIQAAVLHVKLPRLEEWIRGRRAHAAAYDRDLGGVAGLVTPRVRPGNRHTYHQYTVLCSDRNEIASRLDAGGIGHRVYYPVPLHLVGAFEGLSYKRGDFPVAERAAEEVLSLPVYPSLSVDQRERVISALRSGIGEGSHAGS